MRITKGTPKFFVMGLIEQKKDDIASLERYLFLYENHKSNAYLLEIERLLEAINEIDFSKVADIYAIPDLDTHIKEKIETLLKK